MWVCVYVTPCGYWREREREGGKREEGKGGRDRERECVSDFQVIIFEVYLLYK